MKEKPLYSYNSYKSIMDDRLLGSEKRGQLSRASEYLNCQRSYLSRVISDKEHLTPDQAYLICQFWKLTTSEREYFITLVDYERAGHPEFKSFLKAKIIEMKKKYESIQERTQRQSFVTDNLQLQYFSSWISCALQFLTMIPQLQTVQALSERLSLKPQIVSDYLSQLQKQDLVEFKNNKWINKSNNFHLPKESPLVVLHHQNWRNRATLDAQNIQSDHIHFTGVYTVSITDYHRIKEMLLSFIADTNLLVGPSECEEGIALTCDLFRI